MLQISALLMGFVAWGVLIVSIMKNKTFTQERKLGLYSVSWVCCAIALYIPSLCQHLEFKAKDYSGVIDCASTYHLLSAVLLVVNLLLTMISVLLQRRNNR